MTDEAAMNQTHSTEPTKLHPLAIEMLVNCAECGRILKAEVCNHDERPFGKQVLVTVEPCKSGESRHYFCSCGAACTAEEYITHFFELGHDKGVEAKPGVSASAAPTVDRALYSELIHVAAELVRAEGFLSTCAEDLAPRLRRADILKTAEGQERRLKDWAYRVRRVADQLSSTAPAFPVALQDEAKPQYDLDPLEFWCDLAEVLGHSRPTKADVPALVSEVKELLAVTTTKEKGDG